MDTVVLRHGDILNEEAFEKTGGSTCQVCDKKYSILSRKHNCRVCGGMFCSNCAPKIAILEGSDDELIRICHSCTRKITKGQREEAGLERQKLKKVQEVLKAKTEGIETKTASPKEEVDGTVVMQLQQKMRMQEQVQRHSSNETPHQPAPELVLEPLDSDWSSKEYRVVCVPESRWVPDDAVTKCPTCLHEFTNQLRRHHCRGCGNIYCSPCAPFVGVAVDAVRVDTTESVRMCGPCVQKAVALKKRANAAKGNKIARVLAEKRAAENAGAGAAVPAS